MHMRKKNQETIDISSMQQTQIMSDFLFKYNVNIDHKTFFFQKYLPIQQSWYSIKHQYNDTNNFT